MKTYQTGALTEAQCVLITGALQKELDAANTADYPPDFDKINALTELTDLFGDPAGNMIELDENNHIDLEDEGERWTKRDEDDEAQT